MTPETSSHAVARLYRRRDRCHLDLELKSEIEASPALRQEMERLSALHHVIKTRATRFNAPSRLSKSLHAALPGAQTDSIPLGVPSWWRTLAIGTSAAAVALLLWSLGSTFLGP